MSAFQENLKEYKKRVEYAQGRWFLFSIALFISSSLIVYVVFDSDNPDNGFLNYLFNAPHGKYPTFYLFFGSVWALLYFWWYGLPEFAAKPIERIAGKVLSVPSVKTFVFDDLKISPPSYDILRGRRRALDNFFYQTVTFSDELPRSKRYKYLVCKEYDISNMFDFNPATFKKNKNGTKRIISYFRDGQRERLVAKTRVRDKKKREEAIRRLKAYDRTYIESNEPSKFQEDNYDDLWRVIDGMMDSYSDEYNRIEIADLPSPLVVKLDAKKKQVVWYKVDESIDVYRDGKIYFSMRMVVETMRNLTLIFSTYLRGHMEKSNRLSRHFTEISEDEYRQMLDFFKVVMMRRLLLNYGGIPSGWFVGRIESYDLRAILSAVDREMIPTITKNNDGSNDIFDSDVLASKFLFAYWGFMKDNDISKTIEAIDWCFDAVKSVNEMQAREYARENMRRVLQADGYTQEEIEAYENPFKTKQKNKEGA